MCSCRGEAKITACFYNLQCCHTVINGRAVLRSKAKNISLEQREGADHGKIRRAGSCTNTHRNAAYVPRNLTKGCDAARACKLLPQQASEALRSRAKKTQATRHCREVHVVETWVYCTSCRTREFTDSRALNTGLERHGAGQTCPRPYYFFFL